MTGRLAGRVAVVTGASAGIGRELARLLHDQGARVLVAGRDRERTRAVAREVDSPLLLADHFDLTTVARLGCDIRGEVDHIDYLFSNAGAALTHRETTVDGNEPNLQVNALAPLLLERLLVPSLLAADAPRVIATSSHLHRRARLVPGQVAAQLQDHAEGTTQRYGRAKLAALIAHAHTRTEPDAVATTDVHPGVVASDFGRYMGRIGTAATVLAAPFLTSPAAAADILATVATSPGDLKPYHHRRTAGTPSDTVSDEQVQADVAHHVEGRLAAWLATS